MSDEKDWGAIIKHNDELTKKFQNDSINLKKERQQHYKDELDYLRSIKSSQKLL